MEDRWYLLGTIIILVLLCTATIASKDPGAIRFSYSAEPYDFPLLINISGLSITSVIYNPSSKHSPWVSRLLGEEAIFHNRSYSFRAAQPLSPREKAERSQIFQNYFRLPSETLVTPCSLEIFGYIPTDIDDSFTYEHQMNAPTVGTATLSFPTLQTINSMNSHLPRQMTWTCYYRATYENTARQAQLYVHQYWAVFMYCPAPSFDHSCLSLLHLYHQEFVGQLKTYYDDVKKEKLYRNNDQHEVDHEAYLNRLREDSPYNSLDDEDEVIDITLKTFPSLKSRSNSKANQINGNDENPFLKDNLAAALDVMEAQRVTAAGQVDNRRTLSNSSISRNLLQSNDVASSQPYKRYSNIISTAFTDFRELYSATPAIYPNSLLAYMTALLSSNFLSYARLNFPRPLYEYQVSPGILSIIARLQKLALYSITNDKQIKPKMFHTSQILIPLRLTVPLQSKSLEIQFDLDLVNSLKKVVDKEVVFSKRFDEENVENTSKYTAAKQSRRKIAKKFTKAVCTVIPYSSYDEDRSKMNSWMVYEFIRYYSRMGFLVMMYDRQGDNLESINKYYDFEEQYGLNSRGHQKSINGDEEESPWNLRYYDFTIFQLLRLYPKNIVFNNKDGMLNRAIVKSDFDKRLTLTQCRQTVKQLYGIEEVLVIDFDEFLYCPQSKSSALLQEQYYDEYMAHMKNKGIDQFVVKQRVVASKQEDMKTCLYSEYQRNEKYMTAVKDYVKSNQAVDYSSLLSQGLIDVAYRPTSPNRHGHGNETYYVRPSLFHCLSPYEYGIKMFFEKAVHLTHACPFTSFHYASYLRQFDCFTNSYTTTSKSRRNYSQYGCSVVHITTKINQYNRTHTHDMEIIQNSKHNELYSVCYGPLH